MYAKCGELAAARCVFDSMQQRDVVSWTAIILGYVEFRQEEMALALFLHSRGACACVPDARFFVAGLKACSNLISRLDEEEEDSGCDRSRILDTGIAIHHDAIGSGHGANLFVQNSLIDMYAKCGNLTNVRRVFEVMADPDVVSFNSVMLGYVDSGEPRLALNLFARMKEKQTKITPDARSYLIAIKACTGLAAAEEGELLADGKLAKVRALETSMTIHSQALAFASSDNFLANSLVTAYANCGSWLDARVAFDKVHYHDVVSWNALILSYAENEEPDVALDLLSRMSCTPNAATFVAALKACTAMAAREKSSLVDLLGDGKKQSLKVAALSRGGRLHSQIASCRCEKDVYVASALVDMYAKCGSISRARRVFDAMSTRSRNVVTWNAIILGYADHGDASPALELLARMQLEGECRPNVGTFVAALRASCGDLDMVRAVHALVNQSGTDQDELVITSLVDSYGKCGSVGDCERVFGLVSTSSKNPVTWNAVLAGYSRLGDFCRSRALFHQMVEEEVPLSNSTFVCLLTACSHAGLVEAGSRYFEIMQSRFGLVPDLEHYHCLVDMLGRANRVQEAMAVATAMPFKQTAVTWTILLSACWKWTNVEVGRIAFENLVNLNGKDDAACLLMAKLYGSKGMWEEQLRVQEFSCR